jgi:hypothetical protein
VKGHYKGKRQLSHELNHLARKLAGEFNSIVRSTTSVILSPLYEAESISENQQITSRFLRVIMAAMHDGSLRQHIKKRANWSDEIFDKVDWVAHYQAFKSFKRLQRLSISKLVHGLYHTNREAHKTYGHTSNCPCCNSTEETFNHIFTCPNVEVVTNRQEALTRLKDALISGKTPEKLIDALLHGLQSWTGRLAGDNICPLYRGTVLPDDIALVQAFHEQTAIGWDHLLRGRISQKWSNAYQICTGTNNAIKTGQWTKHLIRALWYYSKSLWVYRNGVVHGHSKEEEKAREKERLQRLVEEEFKLYQGDQFIVSPQFAYLFSRRTKEERLQMDRDALSSWLRTVQEAKNYQIYFRQSLSKLHWVYIGPRCRN